MGKDQAFHVHATDNPAECKGMRFALVLVKAWQTERAAHQLSDCLAEDGVALTLQNGLGNDTMLAACPGIAAGCQGCDHPWRDLARTRPGLPGWRGTSVA